MSVWTLENKNICLKISNDNGGVSIRSLYDKDNNYEWVHTQEKGISAEGIYDSVYDGGYEFLFPTDAPCQIGNVKYQDHGFLWTTFFETKGIERDRQTIVFNGEICEINVGVRIEISLDDSAKKVHFAIAFKNYNETAVPYLFRLHPSIRLNEKSKLSLNGTDILFEYDKAKPKACDFQELKEAEFPYIKYEYGEVNLEDLCACELKEIFCHIKQKAGNFEIKDVDRRMRVSYDHCKLPILTLYFFNNGQKVVILEPSTSDVSGISKFPDEKSGVWLRDKDEYAFDFTIK